MDKEERTKNQVKEFWNEASCGEIYAGGSTLHDYFESQAQARYNLEPYLRHFAQFCDGEGKDILEIGVGMGADHVEWARSNPHALVGIDLTERAIEHTRKRLAIYGFCSHLSVGDAEALPFDNDSFDLVYSWGVLHHSPDTQKAINEVLRVLRPNGDARIMIYHSRSLVGYMLWTRYGLFLGRPFRTLEDIYSNYLESPGTSAYTVDEASRMFSGFAEARIHTQLSFGDLLQGAVGKRHRSWMLSLAKRLWPRKLIRSICKYHGLYMLINAKKKIAVKISRPFDLVHPTVQRNENVIF